MEQNKNPHAGHRRRKKELFLHRGLDAFAPHEALELLLYYAIPRQDTNGIAHALLERFGSLDNVFKAPVSELVKVPGVGESAALLLHLVPQIFQRSQIELDKPGLAVGCYTKAAEIFQKYFWGERGEIAMMMCLDNKCRFIACHKLGAGGVSGMGFNIRTLVQDALTDNASLVYLAHNHPSGVALPSEEDKLTTRQIYIALRAVGIELADHLIIAEGDYTSMDISGMIERDKWRV